MSENTNTPKPEQQPTHATPADNGGQGTERLFTQDELNSIIQERLARERAKAEPTPEEMREADLKSREAKMTCREFIADKGYPSALLDILPTNDAEAFQKAVKALDNAIGLPSKDRKPPARFMAPVGLGGSPAGDSLIADAFKLPKRE